MPLPVEQQHSAYYRLGYGYDVACRIRAHVEARRPSPASGGGDPYRSSAYEPAASVCHHEPFVIDAAFDCARNALDLKPVDLHVLYMAWGVLHRTRLPDGPVCWAAHHLTSLVYQVVAGWAADGSDNKLDCTAAGEGVDVDDLGHHWSMAYELTIPIHKIPQDQRAAAHAAWELYKNEHNDQVLATTRDILLSPVEAP